MKSLIIIFSFIIFGFTSTPTEDESNVYICNSKTSTKYHLVKDCRGLNACKSNVVKITKKAAQNAGKKLCGWED